MVEWVMLGSGALLGGLFAWREIRREGRAMRLVEQLRASDPLYVSSRWSPVHYQWDDTADGRERWRRGVLIVTHKRIAIYPYPVQEPPEILLTIVPDDLRGFWRPRKYLPGENDIWIHARLKDQWRILRLRLHYTDMQKLVRALKAIATREQVKAYRRRRPYLHRGPARAFPAQQTLQGAWELGNSVDLYLMPLYLVVQREQRVLEEIPLLEVQDIASLARMEGGKPAGLLRFTYGDQQRAFALDPYEAWAVDLAEAAKRTLEEPPRRKRKGKDDDDDEDDDWL